MYTAVTNTRLIQIRVYNTNLNIGLLQYTNGEFMRYVTTCHIGSVINDEKILYFFQKANPNYGYFAYVQYFSAFNFMFPILTANTYSLPVVVPPPADTVNTVDSFIHSMRKISITYAAIIGRYRFNTVGIP
jgi:hypothetical protein